MLPPHLSQEVQASIRAYFEATYPFRDKATAEAFHAFIAREQEGMFKGPYLSVKLPFQKATSEEESPLSVKLGFPPYDHQLRTFKRLSTRDGHQPEPTILTTGTGSGKTESFLLPLLDYALQHGHRRGIKAIVLYPMNALATDQAARFAEAIYNNQQLKAAKIRVGLLIGVGLNDDQRPAGMGRDHVIEDRKTILDSPPDILLTNFKMLDYLLMRAKYQRIWHHNLADTSLLRYLVLDELHTYDGAQGSDVANLIRRLKLKFGLQRGDLCPVGTSATVGEGGDGIAALCQYAGKVFGETFTPEAIIGETRLGLDDFFAEATEGAWPRDYRPEQLQFQRDKTYDHYVKGQRGIWGLSPRDTPQEIGRWFRKSLLFREIVASCVRAPISIPELIRLLGRKFPDFERLGVDHQRDLLYSLLSLADIATDAGGRPLFALQVQLWLRELSGIVREVSASPAFRWRLPGSVGGDGQDKAALPMWNCRDCGGNGWVAAKPENQQRFTTDARTIFDKYFSRDNTIWFLRPRRDQTETSEYEPTEERNVYVDPQSMFIHQEEREGLVAINACRKYDGHRSDHSCPYCNSKNGVSIVGGRTATLASIITGQVLATELDETPERDRKVLAFTNSVQDAAHQAGFVQSRNYNFSFRTALQTAIKNSRGYTSLLALQQNFPTIWRSKLEEIYPGQEEEAYVHQFFPARLVGKESPEDYRDKDGRYTERFLRELDLAIDWQIAAEFGFNATVGRTLEKTGTGAVRVDPEKLKRIYPRIREWLANNAMLGVDEDNFRQFLSGLLLRMRQRGAVSHPYLQKYRTAGAIQWNLNYGRDARHFLNPTYGPRSRFPRPVVTQPIRGDLPLDTTYTNQRNWFHGWFRRNFQLATDEPAAINEFYQELFPVLEREGIVDVAHSKKDGDNYCLQPGAIQIGADAGAVECPKCNNRQATFREDDALVGMPCTSFGCTGYYEADETTPPNYYRAVYNRRRAPRIYATDHTGLLDRADREQKEADFKHRPNTNSLNALVATSTLEMGIDIGDLNVALLNGVPPLPANFLQRVGRAGRKTGSALVINIAGANSHDLFYFQEPAEMMAGKVHTPGCFLSAKEILKRHFLAYVIDCWSAVDPVRNQIPARLRDVKLYPDQLQEPNWFPNQLVHFLAEAGEEILEEFQRGYGEDEIDPATFEELSSYLRQGHLSRRIDQCFRTLVEDRQALSRQGEAMQKERDSGKYGKEDEAYKEYSRQQRSLIAARRKVDERQTLEQMTNFGLLPNYAFPETGVTMRGEVVSMIPQEDGPPEFRPTPIETVRSAQAALRELVPGSQFYTQGWRLPITGINTVDWEEAYEEYRFCSNCDYLRPASRVAAQLCPICKDPSFATPDNLHGFLQLREVKASAKRDDATIRDQKEERERGGHLITRHFDFDQSDNRGAFALKDIPFGVEYRTRVVMREINAGHQNHQQKGRSVKLAGVSVNGTGYVTCRQCGKSTLHRRKETNLGELKTAEDYHYPYCRHREHMYTGVADEVMSELFLMREIQSEVLKLLLPVQEFETEEHIGMFMAGISLGLRHFYGGNPQHIDLYPHREYNQETDRFDVYLILQDNIPGGTGYLSKLFTPENITEILKLAYRQIKGCSCQDRGLDGCYHCIYSYATKHFSHELSRTEAERLFGRILSACNDWEHLASLSALGNTSQIEESELERRFIRLFRTLNRKEESGWTYREINVDGSINYELHYAGHEREYTYEVIPQYQLGRAQGVGLHTVADHLIRLKAAREAGKELSYVEIQGRKQVACFMDGWAHHASQTTPRFPGDVERRHAIIESGQFLSWTLTFPDIIMAERSLGLQDKKTTGPQDELAQAFSLQGKMNKDISKLPGKDKLRDFGQETTNFGRLRWWMERGLQFSSIQLATDAYLSRMQASVGKENYAPEDVNLVVSARATLSAVTALKTPAGETLALLDRVPKMPAMQFESLLFSKLIGNAFAYRITARAATDRSQGFDKESWYRFWRLFNLLQLTSTVPPYFSGDGTGLDAVITLTQEVAINIPASAAPATSRAAELEEILIYYDPPYHAMVSELFLSGKMDAHELQGDFSIYNQSGVIAAEAVLGSERYHFVVAPFSQIDGDVFTKNGYAVYTLETFNSELL
jgi:DEAD/DEAH box helicase domain-containing protein